MRKGFTKPGPGRPKGLQNKVTVELRDMILNALHKAGGEDYLLQQAKLNPGAFMTLVGKIVPVTVNATVEHKPVTELTEEELAARLGRIQYALAARGGADRGAAESPSGSSLPH